MDLISIAPGLQPLQLRVADLHRRTAPTRRPSSCTAGTAGSGSARQLDRLPGRASSAAPRSRTRSSSPGCHVHSLGHGHRQRAARRRRGRPARRRAAGRSSTRTSWSRRAHRIGVDREEDLARGFTVTDSGHHRRRQGPGDQALTEATERPVRAAAAVGGRPQAGAGRGPAPAAARRLRRRSADAVAAGRGDRRRRRLQLGPLLPAVRRPGRQALRVLDDARRLGRGRPSGSRSARWSPATATATPSCSPTWPAPSTTSAAAG